MNFEHFSDLFYVIDITVLLNFLIPFHKNVHLSFDATKWPSKR